MSGTIVRLQLRRVLLSLRRRIRCDHNQRNRGFLVVAATRATRPHIRVYAASTSSRRPCLAPRVTARIRTPAARGQS
jgi:hypothetical protein